MFVITVKRCNREHLCCNLSFRNSFLPYFVRIRRDRYERVSMYFEVFNFKSYLRIKTSLSFLWHIDESSTTLKGSLVLESLCPGSFELSGTKRFCL